MENSNRKKPRRTGTDSLPAVQQELPAAAEAPTVTPTRPKASTTGIKRAATLRGLPSLNRSGKSVLTLTPDNSRTISNVNIRRAMSPPPTSSRSSRSSQASQSPQPLQAPQAPVSPSQLPANPSQVPTNPRASFRQSVAHPLGPMGTPSEQTPSKPPPSAAEAKRYLAARSRTVSSPVIRSVRQAIVLYDYDASGDVQHGAISLAKVLFHPLLIHRIPS